MQILGKRSKILLIAVAIAMLAALGLSFALWDTQAVKATNGSLSQYANAKIGDIIEFGQYYQTLDKDSNGEYIKTPIKWIVVDKNERTGELTLMSEKILATGSYFGNWYYDATAQVWKNYDVSLVADIAYNQAYVDSTARAFLNNLERLDVGGDSFESKVGFLPSYKNSTTASGLLSSVGFSNKKYWTSLDYTVIEDKAMVDAKNQGFIKRPDSDSEIHYQRPIGNDEYKNRPATRGFFDEAFTDAEKSMIAPKQIAGYIGHRWPDKSYDISTKAYIEGAYDKVWLPSATELNIMNGMDWNNDKNNAWTNPSDESGSTVFEYFKQFTNKDALTNALKATRTELAVDATLGNYSIPVYSRTNGENKALEIIDIIDKDVNSSDNYWTRSASSYLYRSVRVVNSSGRFTQHYTDYSVIGVRPCVIIEY